MTKDEKLLLAYLDEMVRAFGVDSARFKRLQREVTPSDGVIALRLEIVAPVVPPANAKTLDAEGAKTSNVKRRSRSARAQTEFARFMERLGANEEAVRRAI